MKENEIRAYEQLTKIADYAKAAIIKVGENEDAIRLVEVSAEYDYDKIIFPYGYALDNPMVFRVKLRDADTVPEVVKKSLEKRTFATAEEAVECAKGAASKVNSATADLIDSFRA